MSSGAQVAVLRPGWKTPPQVAEVSAQRPHALRTAAFAALGLYGAVRWSRLLAGGSHGRLIGILALALLLAGARPLIARRNRWLAAAFTAITLVAVFPVAGLPLAWIFHLRLAVIASAIGNGLSGLGRALIPYTGGDQWVRLDIVLGGAVLLFDAALMLAFAPRRMDGLRRASAALPLVALDAVPSTLVHPRFPYLNGLVLFLLLAAFMLGDRIANRHAASAAGLCLVTAIASMLIAPALARRTPLINYWTLTGSLAPSTVEVFDWSQTYGPVDWPRHGRIVLEVTASRPEYWKAQDLDVFDGSSWTEGNVPGQENAPAPAASALAQWSQTLRIRVRNMRTSDLIGSGVSSQPTGLSEPLNAGFSVGTWTTGSALKPGDAYTVRTYTPQPSSSQLNAAGTDYGTLPAGYRTLLLPQRTVPSTDISPQVVFPVFHTAAPVQNLIGLPISLGAGVIQGSTYGPAYRLAIRLARAAPTPYAFVLAVERYLAHGYTYSQKPPVRRYPLESFLFRDRRGYCQHFAGAMALLLRMGGVPAEVAAGFTQGRQSLATGHWLVTDANAHVWVEVWFPRYGWVRFDPTPSVDPALSDLAPVAGGGASGAASSTAKNNRHIVTPVPIKPRAPAAHHGRVSSDAGLWEAGAGGAALLLTVLGLAWVATRPLAGATALVGELERAMTRTGRPLATGATLTTLEHKLRGSPQAREYIRILRQARFGGSERLPTRAQRRALRRYLGRGSGPVGKLRALGALPPRRPLRGRSGTAETEV